MAGTGHVGSGAVAGIASQVAGGWVRELRRLTINPKPMT